MGNRFRGGIEPGRCRSLHRYLGNPVLSLLGRLFFHIPIGDFHCGMRAFRRDRILELGLRTPGMEFASEMVVRASLHGCDISEVPTTLRPDGRSAAPHLRTWRDGWRHLRFLLAFSPRWLLLYPSFALLVVGLAGMAVARCRPASVGASGSTCRAMLAFATMFVLGVQSLGLAVFPRSYAAHLGLLAQSQRLVRVLMRVSLERGLALGGLLLIAGGVCFVVALTSWSATGFGPLDVVSSLRLPIVGSVLAITGFSIITVSFTLSMTRIGDRYVDDALVTLPGRRGVVAYVPGLVLLAAVSVPPGLLMVALAPAASVAVAGVTAVLVAPVGLPLRTRSRCWS